jgi:hypothetical protein
MPAYDHDRFAPAAPVAIVSLRHPDSGATIADVPMLIDSGADATLLPGAAVASLGLEGTGELYRLVAFDGTTNESEAVRAVLVFLNKTFRGRFLQVDSEVGVLGRNVLNAVHYSWMARYCTGRNCRQQPGTPDPRCGDPARHDMLNRITIPLNTTEAKSP